VLRTILYIILHVIIVYIIPHVNIYYIKTLFQSKYNIDNYLKTKVNTLQEYKNVQVVHYS